MSLLWETQVALVDIIRADAALIALLDNIIEGTLPEGQPRPNTYLEVGEVPGEVQSGTFGNKGKDSLLWIHIWDNGAQPDGSVLLSKERPLAIAANLERLFDRKKIALDQWTMLLGELHMVRLVRDNVIPYLHGTMQYHVLGKAPVAP